MTTVSLPRLALNTREAAAVTGMSVDAIKQAIRSGALRAKRSSRRELDNGDAVPAGKYLVTVEALREWLEGMEDA